MICFDQLYCCGVSGAADWNKTVNFDWEKPTYNKPEGCCHYKREIDQAVQLSAAEIEVSQIDNMTKVNPFS